MPDAQTELVNRLNESILDIVFTKADGTERAMKATRSKAHIPEKYFKSPPLPAEDLIVVYDTEADGWRQFHFNKLISAA